MEIGFRIWRRLRLGKEFKNIQLNLVMKGQLTSPQGIALGISLHIRSE